MDKIAIPPGVDLDSLYIYRDSFEPYTLAKQKKRKNPLALYEKTYLTNNLQRQMDEQKKQQQELILKQQEQIKQAAAKSGVGSTGTNYPPNNNNN